MYRCVRLAKARKSLKALILTSLLFLNCKFKNIIQSNLKE